MTETADAQPHRMPTVLIKAQAVCAPAVGIRDVKSGIYFLWGNAGELLYVGQSLHVAHRCTEHAIKGLPFTRATWQAVPPDLLGEFESHYVFEFSPALNKALQARGSRVNNRMNRKYRARARPGVNPTNHSWGFSGARYMHTGTKND